MDERLKTIVIGRSHKQIMAELARQAGIDDGGQMVKALHPAIYKDKAQTVNVLHNLLLSTQVEGKHMQVNEQVIEALSALAKDQQNNADIRPFLTGLTAVIVGHVEAHLSGDENTRQSYYDMALNKIHSLGHSKPRAPHIFDEATPHMDLVLEVLSDAGFGEEDMILLLNSPDLTGAKIARVAALRHAIIKSCQMGDPLEQPNATVFDALYKFALNDPNRSEMGYFHDMAMRVVEAHFRACSKSTGDARKDFVSTAHFITSTLTHLRESHAAHEERHTRL